MPSPKNRRSNRYSSFNQQWNQEWHSPKSNQSRGSASSPSNHISKKWVSDYSRFHNEQEVGQENVNALNAALQGDTSPIGRVRAAEERRISREQEYLRDLQWQDSVHFQNF